MVAEPLSPLPASSGKPVQPEMAAGLVPPLYPGNVMYPAALAKKLPFTIICAAGELASPTTVRARARKMDFMYFGFEGGYLTAGGDRADFLKYRIIEMGSSHEWQ